MQQLNPLEYIKIGVANAYGLDKETWDTRLNWFDNLSQGDIAQALKDAKEPILIQKGLNAFRDALNGVPTGYMCNLDATASGIQIMAALTGCHKTAERVNLINTGNRENVYQYIPDKLNSDFTADEVKKPIMTTFYGSKKQPQELFGEDTPELAEFYETLEEELPGAMMCKEGIRGCWQGDSLYHAWRLFDGHTAYVPNMVLEKKKIEIDEFEHGTFHHLMYVNKSSNYGTPLIGNIVHSVDGYIVREMLRKANEQGFHLLTIHDSFQ